MKYACNAIRAVNADPRYIVAFEIAFMPDSGGIIWLTEYHDYTTGSSTETGQFRRQVALLLMAELIETGELENILKEPQ